MNNLKPSELSFDKDKILADLRKSVRRSLFKIVGECLASPNLLILSTLGVDAESTLLHIFVEESTLLLNQNQEDLNATTPR